MEPAPPNTPADSPLFTFILNALYVAALIGWGLLSFLWSWARYALVLPPLYFVALRDALWLGGAALPKLSESPAIADDPLDDWSTDPPRAQPFGPRPTPVGTAASHVSSLEGSPDEPDALRGYLNGPAVEDLLLTWQLTWSRQATLIRRGREELVERETRASYDPKPFVTAQLTGSALGIVPGAVTGGLLTVLLGLLQALVVALMTVSGWATGALVVGADAGYRYARHIPWTTCGACTKRVGMPIFVCPDCGTYQHDLKPGRYGFLLRICRCGRRLPTPMLISAHRLAARCPRCEAWLPLGAGMTPELVVAFVGSVGSGKTRLLYALNHCLREVVEATGDQLEALDDDTDERLKEISNVIAASGRTAKTATGTPRGYGLKLTIHSAERFIYLFDPAGEYQYTTATGRELRFLPQITTMLWVLDPLSVESFWARLPTDVRSHLSRFRSTARSDTLAFDQICEQMISMGARTERMGLAIVISKADLLSEAGFRTTELAEWFSDPDGLDLGNQARYAERKFSEVRFFRTAAVVGEDGLSDPSIEPLLRWILRRDGVRLGEVSRAR